MIFGRSVNEGTTRHNSITKHHRARICYVFTTMFEKRFNTSCSSIDHHITFTAIVGFEDLLKLYSNCDFAYDTYRRSISSRIRWSLTNQWKSEQLTDDDYGRFGSNFHEAELFTDSAAARSKDCRPLVGKHSPNDLVPRVTLSFYARPPLCRSMFSCLQANPTLLASSW